MTASVLFLVALCGQADLESADIRAAAATIVEEVQEIEPELAIELRKSLPPKDRGELRLLVLQAWSALNKWLFLPHEAERFLKVFSLADERAAGELRQRIADAKCYEGEVDLDGLDFWLVDPADRSAAGETRWPPGVYGVLTVTATPVAHVYSKGDYLGATPLETRIEAGCQTLELVRLAAVSRVVVRVWIDSDDAMSAGKVMWDRSGVVRSTSCETKDLPKASEPELVQNRPAKPKNPVECKPIDPNSPVQQASLRRALSDPSGRQALVPLINAVERIKSGASSQFRWFVREPDRKRCDDVGPIVEGLWSAVTKRPLRRVEAERLLDPLLRFDVDVYEILLEKLDGADALIDLSEPRTRWLGGCGLKPGTAGFRPSSVSFGELGISSNIRSKVFLGEALLGETPFKISLPAGRYELRLVNAETGGEHPLQVDLKADESKDYAHGW